jgi:hypothetical protein
MLPRSDKVYVAIVVAAAGILVLVSIVGAILTLTRDPKPRPSYESAPAPALVPPGNSQIVDLVNAQRPPISDADFTVLHRATKRLAPALLRSDWRNAAAEVRATTAARKALAEDLAQYRQLIGGLASEAPRAIIVRRPVEGKTRSSTVVRYTGTDANGDPLEETLVSFDFYWERDAAGWRLFDVATSVTGGATTGGDQTPTGDGAADGSQGPAVVPDDLDTPTGEGG